jgi:hypothetical protein
MTKYLQVIRWDNQSWMREYSFMFLTQIWQNKTKQNKTNTHGKIDKWPIYNLSDKIGTQGWWDGSPNLTYL